jgi:hypothetical protein
MARQLAAMLCTLLALAVGTALAVPASARAQEDATLPSECNDQTVEPTGVILACADGNF